MSSERRYGIEQKIKKKLIDQMNCQYDNYLTKKVNKYRSQSVSKIKEKSRIDVAF